MAIDRDPVLVEQDFFSVSRVRRAAQQISYGAGAEVVRDTLMTDGSVPPTEEQAYLIYVAAKLLAGE